MKKIVFLLILIIFFTGCGKEVTKTCQIKSDSYEQIWEFKAKRNKVNAINLDINYDNSLFNIESLDSLNNTEKLLLKREILKKLDLLDESYPGLNIDVLIKDKLSVKIIVDLNKANSDNLKKIGITFQNYEIDNIIKDMEKSGAKCN